MLSVHPYAQYPDQAKNNHHAADETNEQFSAEVKSKYPHIPSILHTAFEDRYNIYPEIFMGVPIFVIAQYPGVQWSFSTTY